MQPQHGFSAHPSLPQPPHRTQQNAQAGPSAYPQRPSPATVAAQVTAALAHPYAQFQYPQASHYAQAYAQYPGGPAWAGAAPAAGSSGAGGYANGANAFQGTPSFSAATPRWHQGGSHKCTRKGCTFTGSPKSVETHMMDRHLIYPPGWERRKSKDDWDADPSLKGKPILIQGTNVKLDTPEAIEGWIAERKKRYPTAGRVEEKQKKIQEAIANGQLLEDDSRFSRKRRRIQDEEVRNTNGAHARGRGRGRGDGRERGEGRGRANGRGRGRGTDGGWRGRGGGNMGADSAVGREHPVTSIVISKDTTLAVPVSHPQKDSETMSDSDSDSAPEVVSSKPPDVMDQDLDIETANPVSAPAVVSEAPSTVSNVAQTRQPIQSVAKPLPRQPRRPIRNPFDARPSLLRNLLHSEVQMTVSNLSQAIRFLVSNDFLENVELKPGQANEKMIEVVGQTEAAATSIEDSAQPSVAAAISQQNNNTTLV